MACQDKEYWRKKLVVKNIPAGWLSSHIRHFLETMTQLKVAKTGVEFLANITHTALVTFTTVLSDECVIKAQSDAVWYGETVELIQIKEGPASILLCDLPQTVSQDHLFFYFDSPRSGGMEGEVLECEPFLPDLGMAVVIFTSHAVAANVLAVPEHCLSHGTRVRVEPYYEEFHKDLLHQLASVSTQDSCSGTEFHKDLNQQLDSVSTQDNCHGTEFHKDLPHQLDFVSSQDNCSGTEFYKDHLQQLDFVLSQDNCSGTEFHKDHLQQLDISELTKDDRSSNHLRIEPEEDKGEKVYENQKRQMEQQQMQKLVTGSLSVAPCKLRLLKELAADFNICQVTVLEGKILFHATEDRKIDDAKYEFLKAMQNLHEDNLSVLPAITTILGKQQGQKYMNDLHQAYPRCSLQLDVQNSCIVCVAHTKADVDKVLGVIKSSIRRQVHKVPSTVVSASTDLQAIKVKLEMEYLVQFTLPIGGSNQIVVDGINGDVNTALREMQREVQSYIISNQLGREKYYFSGALAEKAIIKWHMKDVDDAKALVLKHGGDFQQLPSPSGYTLMYKCGKEMIGEVKAGLGNIHIACTSIDLHEFFKSYSERVLMINGLHINGKDAFCVAVQETVKKQRGIDTILDINLPPKCSLRKLRYSTKQSKGNGASKPNPYGASKLNPHGASKSNHHGATKPPYTGTYVHTRPGSHLHDNNLFRMYTTTVGNTTVIVKDGDISKENVDALVSVVGEDLDMQGTMVGSSIMKRFPQAAQDLRNQQTFKGTGYQGEGCQVISTPLMAKGFRGQVSSGVHIVLHVVLKKLPESALKEKVMELTEKCLKKAVESGAATIAFPPLGVGRRFGFDTEYVSIAMITALVRTLQKNPFKFKKVIFVIYDDLEVAKLFKVALKQMVPKGRNIPAVVCTVEDTYGDTDVGCDLGAAAAVAVDGCEDDEEGDWKSSGTRSCSDDEDLSFDDLPDDTPDYDLQDTPAVQHSRDKLIAQVCTQKHGTLTMVRDILVEELKSTFLWKDSIKDIATFKKLGSKAVDEIQALALKENVLLHVLDKGKDGKVTVCGQRAGVVQVIFFIKEKIIKHQSQDRKETRPSHRHKVTGLKDTRYIPDYWKCTQGGVLRTIEEVIRSMMTYGQLHKVDEEEQKAIKKLIKATWKPEYIGQGKDGQGLHHKKIKVLKVKRLESPELWEGYSSRRERIIRRLELRGKTSFTPVEKLPGSTGPLLTTNSLSRCPLLRRKIYPMEINEHYLFHGTKKEYIKAIIQDGLDNRISNDNAMLGRGIYASESATKADQYTDDRQHRTSGKKTMILLRVLLGQPYLNKSRNPYKYNRPPCMKCAKDRCTGCKGADKYDSVIDDAGRNFREFVVYESQLCYPEYFITYERV